MSEHDAPSAHEWETALEQLEVQLLRAERMGTPLDAKYLELSLPASLNTIPRYLLATAQSLVERQQRLVALRPEPEPESAPETEDASGLISSETWEPRAARGGTLHDRVGHLITGPREPVTFEIFGGIAGEGEPSGGE